MTVAKKRIGYVRIAQESNAMSPVLTELKDFEQVHLMAGEVLHAATTRMGMEVKGLTRNAELSGFRRAVARFGEYQIEAVPLFSAWAISGGPLSAECFAGFLARLRASLEAAGPLDGLFFAMHGAMGAVGSDDPESVFLRVCRDVLGEEVPIAVTLDLHAQVTVDNMALADIVCGYQTNPHRDHRRVGRRAGRLLIEAVLAKVRPTMAWRSLPMVMGGGATVDFMKPMRPVFRHMARLQAQPGVRYVSLFMCHLWNDHPDLGWSTVVVTDGDAALAERVAEELADVAWGVRNEMPPAFETVASGLEKVRAARTRLKLGVACVCDASDVVGAGGTGENTNLLAALLADAKDLTSLVPIRDPAFVAAHWELPEGAAIADTVGGRLHVEYNPAVAIEGKLQAKRELDAFGRTMVVDLDHVKLVVTEGPAMVMRPRFYRDVGLKPMKADICVVKSFFPFRLFFLAENRLSLYVKTRGITDMDLVTRLEFNDAVHPVADVPNWREADRRRRGVAEESSG
ncbi:MAG: microcystin degradation protein MlrC [Myxococcota bacterium]|jgi:microcystin degradation protein MlrC